MRLPLKRGFSPFYTMAVADGARQHRVELWQQPWHRWVAAKLYHWYDTLAWNAPGFRALERWLQHRHDGDPLLYVPLGCRQDIRCYDLMVKQRTVLAVLDIDRETYDRLTPS